MSVSSYKNMGFRNNFKGFDSFEFLKFETTKKTMKIFAKGIP